MYDVLSSFPVTMWDRPVDLCLSQCTAHSLKERWDREFTSSGIFGVIAARMKVETMSILDHPNKNVC